MSNPSPRGEARQLEAGGCLSSTNRSFTTLGIGRTVVLNEVLYRFLARAVVVFAAVVAPQFLVAAHSITA